MIEIHKVNSPENMLIMNMIDKNELLCEAVAELNENFATLISIDEHLPNLSYDMGKAILNAIDLKGIRKVECSNKNLHNTLKKLGFEQVNSKYFLDLTNYFNNGCKKNEKF